MILTESHIKKLQETSGGDSWVLSRVMRNIIVFHREGDKMSASVKIRRNKEGDYDVAVDLNTSFQGSASKFIVHESFLSKMFNDACELRRNCEVFLTAEYNQCCELSRDQVRELAELSRAFKGWIDPPTPILASTRALTISDPILNSLFNGENLDLALRGGHLELDTGPSKMVTVWTSKKYLLPLAQTMTDYLTRQGFYAMLSTVKDQFLGEDIED